MEAKEIKNLDEIGNYGAGKLSDALPQNVYPKRFSLSDLIDEEEVFDFMIKIASPFQEESKTYVVELKEFPRNFYLMAGDTGINVGFAFAPAYVTLRDILGFKPLGYHSSHLKREYNPGRITGPVPVIPAHHTPVEKRKLLSRLRGLTGKAARKGVRLPVVEVRHIAVPPTLNDFEPSDELAKFVIEGFREFHQSQRKVALDELSEMEEEGKKNGDENSALLFQTLFESVENLYNPAEKMSRFEAKEYLKTRIWRMLGTIGRGCQNRREETFTLTDGNKFLPEIQDAILARIPVDIYEAGNFLAALYDELKPVARSGVYGSSWSKLCLDQRNLCLQVTPLPDPIVPVNRAVVETD